MADEKLQVEKVLDWLANHQPDPPTLPLPVPQSDLTDEILMEAEPKI